MCISFTSFFFPVELNGAVKSLSTGGLPFWEREEVSTPLQAKYLVKIEVEVEIQQLSEDFSDFSDFSGLKPVLSNCEITGIGVLKVVQVAVCGMRFVDLHNDTLNELHEWKLIPHFIIKKSFDSYFKMYYLKEIKSSFLHFPIGKSFYSRKAILPESLK